MKTSETSMTLRRRIKLPPPHTHTQEKIGHPQYRQLQAVEQIKHGAKSL